MANIESKIKGCNVDLIVSDKHKFHYLSKEMLPLAKKIQESGVNTVLTPLSWPRDTLYVNSQGKVEEVSRRKKGSVEACPHYAWHGGAYLTGDNFMIGEEAGIPENRKQTLEALGVKDGIFVDVKPFYKHFKDIEVSGSSRFFDEDMFHIDPYFNLGNLKKTIFTWDVPELVNKAYEISKRTGYNIESIPLSDAEFGAMGFIELGDHMVVDCRAEKTMDVLEKVGYKVLPTPEPLIELNRKRGSLRCATKEVPKMSESYLNQVDSNLLYRTK